MVRGEVVKCAACANNLVANETTNNEVCFCWLRTPFWFVSNEIEKLKSLKIARNFLFLYLSLFRSTQRKHGFKSTVGFSRKINFFRVRFQTTHVALLCSLYFVITNTKSVVDLSICCSQSFLFPGFRSAFNRLFIVRLFALNELLTTTRRRCVVFVSKKTFYETQT